MSGMTGERDIRGVRVLLVDDEEIPRETTRLMLERFGADVVTAEDAEQALQIFGTTPRDIIVSDLKLPGMDGIEMLRFVRERNGSIPFILITGYGSVNTAVEALKLGAQDYLLKPIENVERLVNSVWQAVDRYRLIQKNRALQEQLRESEDTFRALFHNANDSIFLCAMDDAGQVGSVMEVNGVACETVGRAREQILGRPLVDWVAAEFRAAAEVALKGLAGRDHISFETSMLAGDGHLIPVEFRAHAFELRGKRVVLSLAHDISERREMEMRIADASERERSMLGHDLHDVFCQDLASLEMLTSVLQKTLVAEKSAGVKDAELIRNVAVGAVSTVRKISQGLYPVAVEREGLSMALEQLAQTEMQMFRIPCMYKGSSSLRLQDRTVQLHLYRIAQEAINNAVKHSRASQLWITLEGGDESCVLTVEDNGRGLRAEGAGQPSGIGLDIMRYRARVIGAVLSLSEREGGGTKIRCSLR